MIEINKPLPLSNLGLLKLGELAIKSIPDGGFLAYFDFEDVHFLEHEKTKKGIEKLASERIPNPLSFSGWVGFFGYEFLGSHLGLNLSANRDLEIPDGWFARPRTIIHILLGVTKIESCLPGRAKEIADSLSFSSVINLDTINFSTKFQRCNLECSA